MTNPRPSISFDRAAHIYDATRAETEDVASATTEALLREIAAAGGGRVLEIGVGTGRITRPLAERGVRVCGVDISALMIGRLVAQLTERHVAPDLVLGDSTRLPLADASFHAALSFHVLHLIPDWPYAVEEIRRVLAPGGVFVHHFRRDEYAIWKDSADKWVALLKARGFERRKRPSIDEIAAKLESLGGSRRVEVVTTDEERFTPRQMIEDTRNKVHSWTWEIPDDLFLECLVEYEEWAQEGLGPLDEPRVDSVVHELHVWSFE